MSKPEIPENGIIETKKAEGLATVFAEGSEALTSTQELLKNLSDVTGKITTLPLAVATGFSFPAICPQK